MGLVPRVLDRLARQLLAAAGDSWNGTYTELLSVLQGTPKAFGEFATDHDTIAGTAVKLRDSGEWEAPGPAAKRPYTWQAPPIDPLPGRDPDTVVAREEKRRQRLEVARAEKTQTIRRREWLQAALEEKPDLRAPEAWEAMPEGLRKGMKRTSWINGCFYSDRRVVLGAPPTEPPTPARHIDIEDLPPEERATPPSSRLNGRRDTVDSGHSEDETADVGEAEEQDVGEAAGVAPVASDGDALEPGDRRVEFVGPSGHLAFHAAGSSGEWELALTLRADFDVVNQIAGFVYRELLGEPMERSQ